MRYWTWNGDVARQWEQSRSRGYGRFVLVRGVLVYGGLWMLICGIIYFFIRPSHPSLQKAPFQLGLLFFATVLGPCVGYLLHARLWRQLEKEFVEWKKRVS